MSDEAAVTQSPAQAVPEVTYEKEVFDWKTHQFCGPQKEISKKWDLASFRESRAYYEIVSFIERVSASVVGKKIRDECYVSEFLQGLISVLETIMKWVEEIAPHEVGLSRFGNTAFREWQDKLIRESDTLLSTFLPEPVVVEAKGYLLGSFGDYQRIDYGSGHELTFLSMLLVFEKIGLVSEPDHPALILRVFQKYLKVMRALQVTYWLEPAGSQGVWGLDDYHFLPFLFGGAQLSGFLLR
eukprot:TRINITY_DN2087_c0_g1_i2.p1 TRINITY_DN2087_c0_g1~~TRINITY_DN2087_c0_g1_i2.p1  ORF type:complete len:241 (-),score=44.02 TRINITY_DN2087_c0_g1_i2:779-1501(-)